MSVDAKTTFVWKTVAFGRRGPGPRSRHGLAYDRGARTTVLFGGMRWSVPELLADTWELWGGQWSRVTTRKNPPARHRGAMTYDARRGQCLLFGGEAREEKGFIRLDDTWAYEGGHWRRLRIRCGPRPRCGHALAFDEGAGVAVLFGGASDRSGPSLADTWVFDGRAWHPITGPAPPARRYAALAYDPELGGCVLNGGSEDDDGARGFGDTWLFREGAWTRLASGLDTHAHDDQGLAYHWAARRLVMFGGLAGQHDVLVREANGWRPVEGLRLPPRFQCSPLIWDDDQGGLVYHGGEVCHGGMNFDTTWALRLSGASA